MGTDITRRTDLRRSRIWVLANALRAHGYSPQVTETEPALSIISVTRTETVTVRCEHRAGCNGELWFFFAAEIPIAPADALHLHEAITAVKGWLAGASG